MYQFKISQGARKDLKKAKKSGNQALLKLLQELEKKPKLKGKELKGDLAGYRSARANPFRVIYKIDDANMIVELIRIDNRDDVYEDPINTGAKAGV